MSKYKSIFTIIKDMGETISFNHSLGSSTSKSSTLSSNHFFGPVIKENPNNTNELAGMFLREKIKKSDSITGDILNLIDDSKNEFNELITDGFVEMVLKGNKDYKTSYEIRDDADQIIQNATNKYRNTCIEFNSYIESLNNKIKKINNQKFQLARMLGKRIKMMDSFNSINLTVLKPSYEEFTIEKLLICSPFLNEKEERKRRSSEYMENAKDFKINIELEIALIHNTRVFLEAIEQNLNEEKQLLDALNKSILNNQLSHNSYTPALRELHILISQFILDENGVRNTNYARAYNKLKQICNF